MVAKNPTTKTKQKKARNRNSVPERSGTTVQNIARGTRSEATCHQTIADRAYRLYVDRGAEHGFALDDWLRAEEDVLGRSE
jgi:hypothetical protein